MTTEQSQRELEPFNPASEYPTNTDAETFDVVVERELARGNNIVKVLHLMVRTPGAPILWALMAIVCLRIEGSLVLGSAPFWGLLMTGVFGGYLQWARTCSRSRGQDDANRKRAR